MLKTVIIATTLCILTVGGGIGLAVAHHSADPQFVTTTRPQFQALPRKQPAAPQVKLRENLPRISAWTPADAATVTQSQFSALAPLVALRPQVRQQDGTQIVAALPSKPQAYAPVQRRPNVLQRTTHLLKRPLDIFRPDNPQPSQNRLSISQALIGVYR